MYLAKKNEIPTSILFFINNINKILEEKKWDKNSNESTFTVISSPHPYDWTTIKIVQKHYSKDKWECKMTHFYKNNDKNIYTWSFNKRI